MQENVFFTFLRNQSILSFERVKGGKKDSFYTAKHRQCTSVIFENVIFELMPQGFCSPEKLPKLKETLNI